MAVLKTAWLQKILCRAICCVQWLIFLLSGRFTTADEGDMDRHLQQAITGPETASLANQEGRTGKARGLWMRMRSLFGV